MTNLTPPDPIDQDPIAPSSPTGPAPTPTKGSATAITIVAAIVGALSLVFAGGTAAFAATTQALAANGASGSDVVVDAAGVTKLNLDADGGSVTIRYGDVTEATLRTEGRTNTTWTMRRDGDTLDVRSPRTVFGWWIGGWFPSPSTTTLTLPEELKGTLDADLTLEAGSLDAAGDFDAVTATVSAGSMTLSGTISRLDVNVEAGRADISAEDTSSVALTMSAGRVDADFTGTQPDRVSLDVSAGGMDVRLPAGSYDLTKDVSAGTVDSGLTQSAGSPNRVSAKVSAGSVTLQQEH